MIIFVCFINLVLPSVELFAWTNIILYVCVELSVLSLMFVFLHTSPAAEGK